MNLRMELALMQWKKSMAEKDKLLKTGCHNGHCFHAEIDPKCRSKVSISSIYKCCRCPVEGD